MRATVAVPSSFEHDPSGRRAWTISSKPSITMVGGVRSVPSGRAISASWHSRRQTVLVCRRGQASRDGAPADVPEAKADLVHAVYQKVVVAGRDFEGRASRSWARPSSYDI